MRPEPQTRHYDITIDAPANHQIRAAIDELTLAI